MYARMYEYARAYVYVHAYMCVFIYFFLGSTCPISQLLVTVKEKLGMPPCQKMLALLCSSGMEGDQHEHLKTADVSCQSLALLRLCEVVGQNVLCQCSEGSTAFSILCRCAVSKLCSSAVRLGVLCGSTACFASDNSSAPVGKALLVLFRQTSFVARHDIPHALVQ